MTGTRFQFVPYRGVGPATQDMMAGRVDLMFDLAANALPHVRAGASRPMPSWPKVAWASRPISRRWTRPAFPDSTFRPWQSIWVPKGTPRDVDHQAQCGSRGGSGRPSVRQRLTDLGAGNSPARASRRRKRSAHCNRAEIEKWWPIIKEANIKVRESIMLIFSSWPMLSKKDFALSPTA